MSLVRALYAGAGALALVALILQLATPRVPEPKVAPPAIPAPEAGSGPAGLPQATSFQEIVRLNIFSPNRTPPPWRQFPRGSAAPSSVRPSSPPALRLYGTALGPMGAVALIDADPAVPGAEIHRVGDRVSGFRVVAIREKSVLLEGPSGRRVLTLEAPDRRSP